MKLYEFAELMGVSLKEAEKMLQQDEVVTINLSKEKVKEEKDKLMILKA